MLQCSAGNGSVTVTKSIQRRTRGCQLTEEEGAVRLRQSGVVGTRREATCLWGVFDVLLEMSQHE